MIRTRRVARRADRFAIVWCALVLTAATATPGIVNPRNAHANPLVTNGPSSSKLSGDPDTPDEGGPITPPTRSVNLTNAANPNAPRNVFGWMWWLARDYFKLD